MGCGVRRAGAGLAFLVVLGATPLRGGPLGWGPPPGRAESLPCPTAVAQPRPADLALVWVDVMGAVRLAYPEAAREVVALLERMGVRATIREGHARSVTSEGELTVVVLPGLPPGSRLDHRVMGATSRSPQGIRAIWVYAAGVSRTLGLDTRRGPHRAVAHRKEFGRALGRVVAHELVHALAPGRPHVKGGLMAEHMGRALLLSSDIAIDAGTSEAFRTAVGGRPAGKPALATLPEFSGEGPAARP
jgi:hypothetical protein